MTGDGAREIRVRFSGPLAEAEEDTSLHKSASEKGRIKEEKSEKNSREQRDVGTFWRRGTQ